MKTPQPCVTRHLDRRFESPIYSSRWFGRMNNTLEDDSEATLVNGRFAYLPQYDMMGATPSTSFDG